MDLARPLRSWYIRHLTDPAAIETRRRRAEAQRQRRGLPHTVHYFHQLDDPHARLAVQALPALLARYRIDLQFLPVAAPAPIAIHDARLWQQWSEQDAAAIAPYWSVDGQPLALQPLHAPPDAESLALSYRVLTQRRPAAEQARMAVALGEALSKGDSAALQALAASAATDPPTCQSQLAANARRRHQLGHYLGGMFHYAGEWFWGLDRLHYLESRLQALGARRPDAPAGPAATLHLPERPATLRGDRRLRLEFFPSLRSPYSHLAYGRVAALAERYPIDLVLRPVLPMMMRGVKADRRKSRYILLDTAREAARLGIAFGNAWDPFGEPVRRAYSLFPWAQEQGKGLAYLQRYSQAVWAERCNAWRPQGLRRIVEDVGLAWTEAQQRLDQGDWEPAFEANVQAMIAAGAWGVPTLRLLGTDGEPDFSLWGQDRIWRMEAEILRRLGAGSAPAPSTNG